MKMNNNSNQERENLMSEDIDIKRREKAMSRRHPDHTLALGNPPSGYAS